MVWDNAPRVLVVEDEPGARRIIDLILTKAGLEVMSAESGSEALALLDQYAFDLLIIDVGLPGNLNGREVLRLARVRQPLLKSLIISGDALPSRNDDPQLTDFIAKPFDRRQLVGCVFELLGRDPAFGTPAAAAAQRATAGLQQAENDTRRTRRPEEGKE